MDNPQVGSVVHKNGRLHSIIQGGITMNEWEAHNPFSEDSYFRMSAAERRDEQ